MRPPMIWAFCVLASLFAIVQGDKLDSVCGGLKGPRECAKDVDVFLKSPLIEIGIHQAASFGSKSGAPAGYATAGRQIGFVCDYGGDGFTVGNPPYAGDYFVPGSPLEGWVLQYQPKGSSEVKFTNKGLLGNADVVTDRIQITSDDTVQQSVWTGHTAHTSVTITTTLPLDKKLFYTDTTITNTHTVPLTNLYLMRNIDPDQTQWWDGQFTTYNFVKYQPQSFGYPNYVNPKNPNMAVVVARGIMFPSMVFVLGAVDPRAFVSHGGFNNNDASAFYNANSAWKAFGGANVNLGQTSRMNSADEGVNLVFKESEVLPGQSVKFRTYFALATSFEEDIEVVAASASPSPSAVPPSASSTASASTSASASVSASPSVSPSPSKPSAVCWNTESEKIIRKGLGSCPIKDNSNIYLKSSLVQLSLNNQGVLYSEGPQPRDFVNPNSFDEGFGFLCDYGADGWTKGDPEFAGEFVDRYVGWGIKATYQGTTVSVRNDKALFAKNDVPSKSFGITRDDAFAQQATWIGSMSYFGINLTVTIPADKKHFFVDATVTNNGQKPLTDLYFSHQINPAVNSGLPQCCVKYQPQVYGYSKYANARSPNTAAVFARSPFERSIRFALAAVDSRAFANQYYIAENDIGNLHNNPTGRKDWLNYGGANTNIADDIWTLNSFNNFLSMNFRAASLPAGQSTTFRTYFGLSTDFELELVDIARDFDPLFVNKASESSAVSTENANLLVVAVAVVAAAVAFVAVKRNRRVQVAKAQNTNPFNPLQEQDAVIAKRTHGARIIAIVNAVSS